MSTETITPPTAREPQLRGQTVVVIGGSAGIGFETARQARAEGAEVILTGRTPGRLEAAAREIGAARTAAFDAWDASALEGFLTGLDAPVDHVMVTAGGPYYAPLQRMDLNAARHNIEVELTTPLIVARSAIGRIRPGGTLLFIGGTGGRSTGVGLSVIRAVTAALQALVANLAVEVAPIRVNLIAPGFVDTGLSASLLGDELEPRREQLRETLPIRRVVGPADVASLAVHVMSNTALTGAVYDIDGGQQFV